MRTVGILVSLCLVVATATGCKGKGDTGAAPDPAAVKAQRELVARRDALLAEQEKLKGESTKLATEIEQAKAAGGETAELEKKKAALDSQIKGRESELNTTSAKLTNIEGKLDAAAGIASREANMGNREKTLAGREAQLAERERTLAGREATLAQREKDTCGQSQPMIIQQVAPPKGGNYTRREVEPMLNRAKAGMAKKGLVASDLGAQAGLEGEVTRAMGEGDWGKAFFAATQLVATIDAIKIDRPFISGKYSRLNARVVNAKVDEATQQQLTDGMKEVLQKYGDGDFGAANRRINQLWGLVR